MCIWLTCCFIIFFQDYGWFGYSITYAGDKSIGNDRVVVGSPTYRICDVYVNGFWYQERSNKMVTHTIISNGLVLNISVAVSHAKTTHKMTSSQSGVWRHSLRRRLTWTSLVTWRSDSCATLWAGQLGMVHSCSVWLLQHKVKWQTEFISVFIMLFWI